MDQTESKIIYHQTKKGNKNNYNFPFRCNIAAAAGGGGFNIQNFYSFQNKTKPNQTTMIHNNNNNIIIIILSKRNSKEKRKKN